MSTEKAEPNTRLLVSAVEPSADLHLAHLLEELSRLNPGLEYRGFGGERMREAGCHIDADPTAISSVGFGFLRSIGHYYGLLKTFDRLLREYRPAAVLLVDAPAFNFLLARLARWRGVPVVYYICPQIWAWAPWRRRKVLRYTDLLMPIIPFEEELYRNDKVPVEYVGHPIADELSSLPGDLGEELRSSLGVGAGEKLTGVFPGSRRQEVEALSSSFFNLLAQMELDPQRHRIAVSALRDEFKGVIEAAAARHGLKVDIIDGDCRALMSACDLALVASGTASLELAWFEKPMLVFYKVNRLGYRLFKSFFSVTPWFALPNILGCGANSGEATVFEKLLRSESELEGLVPLARDLLDDEGKRAEAVERLQRLKNACMKPGANAKAAEVLNDFLNSI